MTQSIHPGAAISSQATLGQNNQIGANVIIEDDVVLGDNNTIMSGAIIKSGTRIGDHNCIHEYVVIGGLPQDLGFKTQTISYVELGDHNTLREYITINRATKEQQSTQLGNHNYLMTHCHVAHDCQLANHIILAPFTALGGHVHVDDRAFISGGVMVHQFVHIGSLAMVGGNTKVTQNILPMMITDGNPARLRGLNIVGLKRNGFKAEDLHWLKKIYALINQKSLSLEGRMKKLGAMDSPLGKHYADFIKLSQRGFHD